MEIGVSIFFTEYSMAPTDLAVALEERGFDSLWVAEHSHIPAIRRFTHLLGDAAQRYGTKPTIAVTGGRFSAARGNAIFEKSWGRFG